VEVTWQDSVTDRLVRGETTRKEVLRLLGPPSQVISMEEETVLYYLFERSKGEGVILIVYNRMKIDTDYDRAVLFFDENDILTDFATRIDDAADA
jgi:outer membrane protein assembly factor BamE (lipoprotein component of BamABCDE complex)